MANEDRWREDRDRYRRGDEGRWSEDRDRHGSRGSEDHRGGSSWSGESYRREGSEGRSGYGREGLGDIYGGDYGRDRDRDRERSGMWGRGDEGRGYGRESGRAYSREDYGASGYGGGYGRDMGAGGSFSTGGGGSGRSYAGQREAGYGGQGRGSYGGRGGFGSDDFAQEAHGQGFSGNEGRGFGYGSDYGRGGGGGTYGGGGYGGGDYGREGYGQRQRSGSGGGGGERGLWERASDEVASWFGDRDAERRREQDYRGRGPKGYRRSDDRIREDINDRLSDDPYVDASDMDVSVSNGEVTLSGTVDSRSARRRAEDIAENVSGVSYVQNNLRVQQAPGQGYGSDTRTGSGATTTPASGQAAQAGGLGESVAYAADPGRSSTAKSSTSSGSSTGQSRSG